MGSHLEVITESIDPKTGKKHYSCFMSLWMELTAFYRHYRAEGRSKI